MYPWWFCEDLKSDLEMEAILSAAKQQHHRVAVIRCNDNNWSDDTVFSLCHSSSSSPTVCKLINLSH